MRYEIKKCDGAGALGQYHDSGFLIIADGEQVGWRPDEGETAENASEECGANSRQ